MESVIIYTDGGARGNPGPAAGAAVILVGGKKVAELKKYDGIIVPGGFGETGIEGIILAIEYARKNKIPYLGLCYGMQLAVIEFCRNVIGCKDAHTAEINPQS